MTSERNASGKGKMTVGEAGRRGGEATKAAHGAGYYSDIGKKGGAAGGPATFKKYGRAHYQWMARRKAKR